MNKVINLVGQKFGQLTVLAKASRSTSDAGAHWHVRCDCGAELVRTSTSLKRKTSKPHSCGCGKKIDLAGQRFSRWTVLAESKPAKPTSNGTRATLWRCLCDCGKEKFISSYALRNGTSRSCGCLSYEESSVRNKKTEAGLVGFSKLWKRYQATASKRNIGWNLTKQQFQELTKQACYYCGAPPSQISIGSSNTKRETLEHGKYIYNGIDRLDNTKDYSKKNCVSSCEMCNRAKRHHDVVVFEAWIEQLINYRQVRGK